MRILAVNVGSTTLKLASFEWTAPDARPIARARAQTDVSGDVLADLQRALRSLPEREGGPDIVVHRIVHGGELTDSCEVDDDVLDRLRDVSRWAPSHQPRALSLVAAARREWPSARHGVAFDTAFHSSLAPWSRRLPIPAPFDASGVRRFGFHGLAFASAVRQLSASISVTADTRIVIAHIGGGTSVAALRGPTCIDTTMGLTPCGGVPMATRSGDLDPGVIFELLRHSGGDADALEHQLSHDAGLAGIAGHGELKRLLEDDAPSARLAVEQYVVRVAQAIASMTTAVRGLDHLVFTGGAGANSATLRERVADALAWMHVQLDPARNCTGEPCLSSNAAGGPRAWRIDIDEAFELAVSVAGWMSTRRDNPREAVQ